MTPMELAREVFPDADDAFLDHAIWAKTGFPCFWALKDGQSVEDKMREQLVTFRDALLAKPRDKDICDHCNSYIRKGAWHCWRCDWNHCFDEVEV